MKKTSLKEIRNKIKKLEATAKTIAVKRKKILQDIAVKMRIHEVSLSELRVFVGGNEAPTAKGSKKTRPKAVIKYQDQDGNTWSGRGKPPRWLVAAEAAGKKREQFLVSGQ